MNYVEPYVKDNNLLQLSLFYFGKDRPKATETTWKDEFGEYNITCKCSIGVPGSFEQDVYTAVLRLWVSQGMPKGAIELNYTEIAKILKLNPKWFGKQIKQALDRLGHARYWFTGCFIQADEDGNDRIDVHCSLLESAVLYSHRQGQTKSKKTGKSYLCFPDAIRKNLEAKYYQYLDMAWYRAIPEGLPRRLYEFLTKKRYRGVNGVFTIGEEAICRWLPIKDHHTTNRRARLEKTACALREVGFLKSFQFNRAKKQCSFTYAQDGPPPGMENPNTIPGPSGIVEQQPAQNVKVVEPPQMIQQDVSSSESVAAISSNELVDALQWLNSIPYLRKEVVKEIASQSDFLTVYPAIRAEYERQKGKIDRPAGWVRKAFANKWQHTKGQKQERREAQEKAREEEYRKQRQEFQEQEQKSRRIIEDQERLRKTVAGLDGYDTSAMWQEADSKVPKEHKIGRETLVKIEFCNLLIAKLNAEWNCNFVPDIFNPAFAIEIAGKFPPNSNPTKSSKQNT